jgi:hypothetical protein
MDLLFVLFPQFSTGTSEKFADQAGLDYENARRLAANLQRMIERAQARGR